MLYILFLVIFIFLCIGSIFLYNENYCLKKAIQIQKDTIKSLKRQLNIVGRDRD